MTTNRFNIFEETKSSYFSLLLPSERKMGSVHSVFKTSFNVAVNNQLFNFSQVGMSLSAHGCLLNKEKMDCLLDSCKPGDIVRVNNGIFSFYTSKEILKVDSSKMQEIDLSIPKVVFSALALSRSNTYSVLESLSFEDKVGLKNEGQASVAFNVLKSVHKCTDEEIERSIDYLIGRGKGLTPSGDDILVGFTLIRKAFLDCDDFEKKLEQRLESHHTTNISHAYFNALFSGFISSHLISLIKSVENYEQKEVKELIDHIGKYGHTSGYDTLFGFYLGLHSLVNEREDI